MLRVRRRRRGTAGLSAAGQPDVAPGGLAGGVYRPLSQRDLVRIVEAAVSVPTSKLETLFRDVVTTAAADGQDIHGARQGGPIAEFLLGPIAWWSIAGGNLIATVCMGLYFWRRHPGLARELDSQHMFELDETKQDSARAA